MNINEFYSQYCNKDDICWQLDMAAEEGFEEEEMLAICLNCIYFKKEKINEQL